MTTIAVAGHNNWGKTTLVRTMTKGTWGVVADVAGSTKSALRVEYPSLRATFVDCPGFTQANTIWSLISKQKVPIHSIDFSDADFALDGVAIDAIREADVVIYVCSLEIAPSSLHRSELRLIKHINPRVLAVLNKRKQQTHALGEGGVSGRELQWRQVLGSEGIGGVFEFDSHWDRYSKLADVYSHLSSLLPPEKRLIFEGGVRAFQSELAAKRAEASKLASGCIRACRALVQKVESERHNFDLAAARAALRLQLASETTELTRDFIGEVRKLYFIEVEPGDQTFNFTETEFKKAGDRIAAMAGHSAIGMGVATIMGGLIGALAGPAGVIAGAALGAKIGAGIGAGAGLVSGAITETNTHLEVRLSSQDLRELALFCLAVMWCLTHQGFGKDPVVVENDFRNALAVAKSSVSRIRHPEWERSSDSTMTSWFDEQLNSLAI